ncbi:PAS domain-containing protein, partial [Melampsora americana]
NDSFCLCNPRLNDNPIVMVSPGFVELTGYQPHEVIGRNPRFFQGNSGRGLPYLRDAIATRRACCELILNHQKDGTPFYCLLNIVPLFDSRGELMCKYGLSSRNKGL